MNVLKHIVPIVIVIVLIVLPLASAQVFIRQRGPCPEGYLFVANYCIEKACQGKRVKCMKEGNLIKRPDCTCTVYFGKYVCGIKGGERTAVKMSTCTRRGQLNSVCGAYDSKLRKCVTR